MQPSRFWIGQSRPARPHRPRRQADHPRRLHARNLDWRDRRWSAPPICGLVADASAALDQIAIFVAVATHDPVAVLVTATAPTLIVIPELEAETRAAPAAVSLPIAVSITIPATVAITVAVTVTVRLC